jgi:prepilin-type processing-associated H-X9-DG protein
MGGNGDPTVEAMRRGITVLEGLVILLVALVLVVALSMIGTGEEGSATRMICLSNVRQCLQAVEMYSDRYDGVLPDRDLWMEQIHPTINTEAHYHCPVAERANADYYGYSFLGSLSRQNEGRWHDPSMVPAIFDSLNMARNASDLFTSFPPMTESPRARRRTVGFLDGHVKYFGSIKPMVER